MSFFYHPKVAGIHVILSNGKRGKEEKKKHLYPPYRLSWPMPTIFTYGKNNIPITKKEERRNISSTTIQDWKVPSFGPADAQMPLLEGCHHGQETQYWTKNKQYWSKKIIEQKYWTRKTIFNKKIILDKKILDKKKQY